MSGKIQRNDIITPEALKVFQEIVNGFKDVISAVNKVKPKLKDSGMEELTFQEAELAKMHQKLGRLYAQLETANSDRAKSIVKVTEKLKKKKAVTKEEITGEKAALAQKRADIKAAKDKAIQDKASTTAIKLKIAAQKKEKGSVDRLRATNALLLNRMKQLNVLIPTQRKQYERLTASVNNNKAKINELNQANRKQATGNKGLMATFKNLAKSALSYAAAMFGVTEIIRFFTSTLLKLTTKLDSLDFSMKTVIKSSSELAQTNIFLSDTAVSYGQDILTLTERYIKFRAATMQANMSAKETQQIFNSTAKAAAVLGLKTDEVNGVFLALEQMISKGKVTTEELRRQLGERLPGAFGIMADAIGVNLRELDKMLKAGEVLSAEALPKFAIALEEAYGIQSVETVRTLAAAQGRLKTSWVQFVDEINASEPYIKTINLFANAIQKVRKAMRSGERIISTKEGEILSETLEGYEKLETKEKRRQFIIQKIGELQQRGLDAQKDAQGYQDKLNSTSSKTANIIARILSAGTLSAKEYDKLQEALTTSLLPSLTKIEGTTLRWSRALKLSKDESTAIARVIRTLKEEFEDVADTSVDAFYFDTYKNKLNEAQKEYDRISSTQKNSVKQQFIDYAAFYEKDKKTYNEYLSFELKELEANITKSDALYNSYQKKIDNSGKEITKEQSVELNKRLQNLEANLDAYVEVNKRLNGINKDTTVQEEKNNENKIKFYKSYLLLTEDMFEAHYIERLSMARGNVEKEIEIEREKIKFQLQGKLTLTERARLNARLRELDDELLKYLTDEKISAIYETADEARIAEGERAKDEFNSTKKRGKDKQLIMAKSAMNMIDIERQAINEILAIEELSVDERAKYEHELAQIKENYAEADIKLTERRERKKREEIANTLNAVKEINQAAFDFNSALNDRAMQANETRYRRETEQAGENAEEKAMAEVKYNEEKRKLMRREAIAQKAQSAFGIIIDTAQAIMATLGETGIFGLPLTPIIAGVGALQLATVLAQPIPEFAKGTEEAPDTFIAGEKKRELIVTRRGDSFLTPNSPTLYSDKSFIGATVLPNDQTEQILSGKSGGSIDLSSTNTLLKDIRDKKDNKETIEYSGGYKIVRKNGFVGKYIVN